MCNCNFEAVCSILNKKMKKIKNGIWTIHLHNHHLSDALDKI